MSAGTKIEWAHHTFNPWWGCTKVSPACEFCYAESFAKRTGHRVWGAEAPRRFFDGAHWSQPLKWEHDAREAGERHRVFCASMADVFEDRRDLDEHRARLFTLIEETPGLDWLLLSKRPENMARLAPARWAQRWPDNAWPGATAEDQPRLDARLPHLLAIKARQHFLSVEPMLGDIDLGRAFECECGDWLCHHAPNRGRCNFQDHHIPDPELNRCAAFRPTWVRSVTWVIVGGESGPGARPCDVAWIRDVLRQCRAAGAACFVKQLGRLPFETHEGGGRSGYPLRDRKGGDVAEWPDGDWPREFPEPRP